MRNSEQNIIRDGFLLLSSFSRTYDLQEQDDVVVFDGVAAVGNNARLGLPGYNTGC